MSKLEERAEIISALIKNLGIDLGHPDFKETPMRVAKVFETICEGLWSKEKIKDMCKKVFPCDSNDMITVQGIRAYWLCPHHLVLIEYDIDVAYIPDGKAIWLSKIARISKLLARQPVIQENLTKEIADKITEHLKPQGVAVRVRWKHFCMVARWIEQINSSTTTSHLIGSFKENLETRNEFLSLINKK